MPCGPLKSHVVGRLRLIASNRTDTPYACDKRVREKVTQVSKERFKTVELGAMLGNNAGAAPDQPYPGIPETLLEIGQSFVAPADRLFDRVRIL